MYDRHSYVVSSEYDSAFKFLITADFADEKMGDVEGPQGHLSALNLGPISVLDYDTDSDWRQLLFKSGENVPSPGHYIIHENISGQIVAFAYDNVEDMSLDWNSLEELLDN